MVCERAVKGMLENQTKHADDDGRGMREEGKSGRTEDEIMCGEKKDGEMEMKLSTDVVIEIRTG